MARHRQTAERTQDLLADDSIARTPLDRGFLRRGRRSTARKEALVFGTEAPDPFSPTSPDSGVDRAPRNSRRRRAIAAVAIAAAAGGLFGGVMTFKGGGNAAAKAPAVATANMLKPVEQAGAKLGAYEKHQQAATEVQQTVNDTANSAATRIIHMAATDPHVRQDPADSKGGPDMYAWGGDFQHPESEVSQYGHTLTVSTINMPGGADVKKWDGVQIEYRIPDSMMGEFKGPMTAARWEAVNLSQLQLMSMNVQDSTLSNSAEGTALSAASGGYRLGGEHITQPGQLTEFGQSTTSTLQRLAAAQAEYN